jgi:hypothetical protein
MNASRKTGIDSRICGCQISCRSHRIIHNPVTSSAALSRMKRHPPRNLVRNRADRETGLLRSRSISPGSNICGMMLAVKMIAAMTPTAPTSHLRTR